MTEPVVRLSGVGDHARLIGAGGGVVQHQGRWALRGDFKLDVAGFASNPTTFTVASGAYVTLEGDHIRLQETAGETEFGWPEPVRLADATDPRAPWLRFAKARLKHPRSASVALVRLDRLAASLVGDARDSADDILHVPSSSGRVSRRLTRPVHPQFPSEAGYFLREGDDVAGIMLGRLTERTNLNHGIALDLILFARDAELWFRLPGNATAASSFVARAVAPRGIAVGGRTPGAGGVSAAAHPGAKKWDRLSLGVETVESVGGRLRVARDARGRGGGFSEGTAWIARAAATSAVADATGIFSPTDRLEFELELPLEAEIATRLPEMRLGYRGRDTGSRYDRHYGVRVAGLAGREGTATALDADYAAFHLTGSRENPALHLKAGMENHWLAPKAAPGGERSLEIAAGDLGLLVTAPARPTTPSALKLNTEDAQFLLSNPSLVAAPVGVTAQAQPSLRAKQPGYKRWTLKQNGTTPKLELKLTPAGLRADDKWSSGFSTADPTETYSAIDHPGFGITIDGPIARLDGQNRPIKTKFVVKTAKEDGDLEKVVYSAFVVILAGVGVYRWKNEIDAFLNPYKTLLEFNKLEDSKYVEEATLKGLQIIYVSYDKDGNLDSGATEGLREWIEKNRAMSNNPAAKEFYWPFAYALSVHLRSETEAGEVIYADEIIRRQYSNPQGPSIARALRPAIAFDMSVEKALDADRFGWASWDALAAQTPGLWPRANGGIGARMDPSIKEWRGIVMRDLPLRLAVNPDALKQMPRWAQDLVAAINSYLMLEYAFRDESGVTWKGGAKGLPAEGVKISPDSWDGVFEIRFFGLTVLGAAGAIRAAECDVEFVLPKLKKKKLTPSDPDEPIRIRTKFGLDLDDEKNPVGRVDVRYNDAPIETDSIPGFKSVAVKRIATNFEAVQIEVDLVATPTLAAALPFLSNSKPQSAFLAFNLKGPPAGVFQLSLPAEIETNLFGRWPLKVQSMRLGWGGKAAAWLEVTGRLNLGLDSLSSVGATVEIAERSGKLDFDLQLDDVALALSLPGAKISGRLGWGSTDPSETKVAFSDIVQADKRDRDMRGTLKVETDGILGNTEVSFRAGNKGELSHWVASAVFTGSKEINLGFGKLKDPGFLIAQNADLKGNLRKLALAPEGAVFDQLRPKDTPIWDWLNGWEPSADIGTVLAASGYFKIDDVIIKEPKDKDEKSLSGVLWIDTGVLRVDGKARLFTDAPAYFGMAVDFRERAFLASFQTGPITLGRYTFQPGRMTIGFGFGGNPYLEVQLGWPPRTGEFDRDWSQALHFHLPEVPPPVNAGWGGMRASIKDGVTSFGVAFRIGWMRADGEARGGSGGGYSIGYAVGGLMEFTLSERAAQTLSLAALSSVRGEASSQDRATAYALIALAAAADLDRTKFELAGEWFGGVWGSAWLSFMGITLASIDARGFARHRLVGSLDSGVTDARATCGFSVSVRIGCVTYSCEARYDIVAVDGGGRVVTFNEFATPWEPKRKQPQRSKDRAILIKAG